jgi:hypothetical protein
MKKQRKKVEEINVIFEVVGNAKIPTNDSRDFHNKNVNQDCTKKRPNYE